MKKLVLFAALAVIVTSCERYMSDGHSSSGVYLNGERIFSIGSTFMGGGYKQPQFRQFTSL